jgi:hypothetical protein
MTTPTSVEGNDRVDYEIQNHLSSNVGKTLLVASSQTDRLRESDFPVQPDVASPNNDVLVLQVDETDGSTPEGFILMAEHHERMAFWCKFWATFGRLVLAAAVISVGVLGVIRDAYGEKKSTEWNATLSCIQIALGNLVGWFCDGKASVAAETHRRRAKSWRKIDKQDPNRRTTGPSRASELARLKDTKLCPHDPALARVTQKVLSGNCGKLPGMSCYEHLVNLVRLGIS